MAGAPALGGPGPPGGGRLSEIRLAVPGGWTLLGERPLSAHRQMALDEVLLDSVARGRRGPAIRFWGWTEPALVIGSAQSVSNEVDTHRAAARGFTVTRRMSGGGTMLAEPGGTITWSLYLPSDLLEGVPFAASYLALDQFAVLALRDLGVAAGYRALNDIIEVAGGGKIAGAAQARRAGAALHHVTMAWQLRPGLVEELIRVGRPALFDRGVRSAEKKVAPLASLVAAPLRREDAVDALTRSFADVAGDLRPGEATAEELAAMDTLVAAKYATPAWIHRIA